MNNILLKTRKGLAHTPNLVCGFTIIELLVVIAIIGILSSIVFAGVNSSKEKARIARAQVDLNQINLAVSFLFHDTELHPAVTEIGPCIRIEPEKKVYLNTDYAGLQADFVPPFPNIPRFDGWDGPYMETVPLDPWGNNYYFDPNYVCGADTLGCNGLGQPVRAIMSFGPDTVQQPGAGSDDIVVVLCS